MSLLKNKYESPSLVWSIDGTDTLATLGGEDVLKEFHLKNDGTLVNGDDMAAAGPDWSDFWYKINTKDAHRLMLELHGTVIEVGGAAPVNVPQQIRSVGMGILHDRAGFTPGWASINPRVWDTSGHQHNALYIQPTVHAEPIGQGGWGTTNEAAHVGLLPSKATPVNGDTWVGNWEYTERVTGDVSPAITRGKELNVSMYDAVWVTLAWNNTGLGDVLTTKVAVDIFAIVKEFVRP